MNLHVNIAANSNLPLPPRAKRTAGRGGASAGAATCSHGAQLMPDLLFELFSEEIPARMQAKAAEDLRRMVTDKLVAEGLVYEGAKAFATPRRLTLTVHGIPGAAAGPEGRAQGPAGRRAGAGGRRAF